MTQVYIVGMKYRPPAQQFVEHMQNGTELLLVREPDNPHDPSAVAVYFRIGYIPATVAKLLAPQMDLATSGLRATLQGEFAYAPNGPKVEIGVPKP